jgi:hypothetical protein
MITRLKKITNSARAETCVDSLLLICGNVNKLFLCKISDKEHWAIGVKGEEVLVTGYPR